MPKLTKEIEAALERLEPAIHDAFLEAIESVTNAAEIDRLIAAISTGDIEDALKALRIEQAFFAPIQPALQQALNSGGVIAAEGLRLRNPFTGEKIVLASTAAMIAPSNGQKPLERANRRNHQGPARNGPRGHHGLD